MKKIILSALVALVSVSAFADEGMWLVNSIDKALEKNMKGRGLKLAAREIYNADAEGAVLTDAIISMDFGCSGSFISKDGLLITNHHCAYHDVYNLSCADPDHNWLEEGFWAMNRDEEKPIEGKSIQLLKKVLDVTDVVEEMKADWLKTHGTKLGSRKLDFEMNKKFAEAGLECMLYSMWMGSKYYMVYYQELKDIRLVAAGPTCMTAFGGDIDNWEWPQQKADFALYRAYTAADGTPAVFASENVPYNPKRVLTVSSKGYKPGSYTMVMGYPGRTERYKPAAQIEHFEYYCAPSVNAFRKAVMGNLKASMEKNAEAALLYADSFFSLSNVQELREGQEKCVKRFGVLEKHRATEVELQKWIESDPERAAAWGTLLADLEENTARTAELRLAKSIVGEAFMRASRLGAIILKHKNNKNFCADKEYLGYIPEVEKDLLSCIVVQYYKYMPAAYVGQWQKQLLEECDGDASLVARKLWEGSIYTDPAKIHSVCGLCAEEQKVKAEEDPLACFFREVSIQDINSAITAIEDELGEGKDLTSLYREYVHARYQWGLALGVPQYPDANSSMRITYGTVGALDPWDGIHMSYFSTTGGILEKYDPSSYDYKLDERYLGLLRAGRWGRWADKDGSLHANFITDNDITGGNSGSAVMNARGELIGLAFDGNKESLAGHYDFTPGYNKCVVVDIRFVMWIIENYCPWVLNELTIN